MKRTVIAATASLLLAGLIGVAANGNLAFTASAQSGAQTAHIESSQAPAEHTAVFTVENMTCASCPITVRRAMERVEGVRSVEVNYAARTATVHFDPSRANVTQIAAASTDVGYPARLAADQTP
jgi:periplasmic mercuric ion binding protein